MLQMLWFPNLDLSLDCDCNLDCRWDSCNCHSETAEVDSLNILTQLQGQHPLAPGAITNNLTGALTALTARLQRVRVNQIDSDRLFRGQCEHSCSSCQLAETL